MLFHTFSLYTSASWPWSLWGWCQALPPELVVIQLIDSTYIMPRKLRYSLMVLGVPSQVALMIKNLSAMQEMPETQVWSMGWEDPLEEEMATHSSSCLENPMDRGAWWAIVCGVAKSWTRLSMYTGERPGPLILRHRVNICIVNQACYVRPWYIVVKF